MMNIQFLFSGVSVLLTAAIAIASWLIAQRQATVSEEKLRLDLYEKRFNIYSCSIDFYQALESWKGSEANRNCHLLFVKAKLESYFLFPPESGVFNMLQEMDDGAFKLIGLKEHGKDFASDPPALIQFYNDGMGGLSNFDAGVKKLQSKMAPYLNFHDITKKGITPKISIR